MRGREGSKTKTQTRFALRSLPVWFSVVGFVRVRLRHGGGRIYVNFAHVKCIFCSIIVRRSFHRVFMEEAEDEMARRQHGGRRRAEAREVVRAQEGWEIDLDGLFAGLAAPPAAAPAPTKRHRRGGRSRDVSSPATAAESTAG